MTRCYCARPTLQAAKTSAKSLLPVFFAALAATMVLCGCNRHSGRAEVQPVEGRVLWNGKPLEGAQVVFCAQDTAVEAARSPRARTGPDGRFRLGTYAQADGAPEGQYVVTVVDFPLAQKGSDSVPGSNVLPQKYANVKTSDLRAQVARGPNTLPPLELK